MRILPALLLCISFLHTARESVAQCPDNQYPITYVDALGNPAPTTFEFGANFAQLDDKNVYMALSPLTPSGVYYVQVSDVLISTVLAATDQLDRVFQVTNVGGVISITRLSATPGLPAPGLGLNGVGQSIPLFPLVAPPVGTYACRFKGWIGQCYEASWDPISAPRGLPWGIVDTGAPAGGCCNRSYAHFVVGDGSGLSTISGLVFNDLDGDGFPDAGEPGLAGWQVHLSGAAVADVLTNASGIYTFPGIAAGNYTVSLVIPPNSGYFATTPGTCAVESCGCASSDACAFGVSQGAPTTCEGHTPGFWSNPNGRNLITQHNLLARLPLLNARTATGALFTTTNYSTFRTWLLGSTATNMAYKLSSHVVAMDFNVAVGFVDGDCMITDPILGTISIANLLEQAIAALGADGYTPTGDPNRVIQERLKNALDAANNNLNWF